MIALGRLVSPLFRCKDEPTAEHARHESLKHSYGTDVPTAVNAMPRAAAAAQLRRRHNRFAKTTDESANITNVLYSLR